MLIQKEDGSLWFKDGDNEQPASPTDICRHFRNMQYNLSTTLGCYATDNSIVVEKLIGADKFEAMFWKLEYDEMPDNCTRIK